jgi:enediyne polyketide synthase
MPSSPSIAIVGMACVYPDAATPAALWENVLAQRRAFRRVPAERLRLEDYWSPDRSAPDRTYGTEAAVIEGYEFDRVAFRVVGSTFRSADLAHWLALDVAARAFADAGFVNGQGLPREATGVLLGNTLTGEFSRANSLRLRWPYVRRVLDAALVKQDWSPGQRAAFLAELETEYKAPFPPVSEESLAGGLSNTIAGRICNQFDLKGGGYTVDGACAASLLAVANACSALAAGDLDLALAGGVDLSLDPFEIVGFAKTGALAPEEMRIYDQRSAGFWPGEGCGFVVLMRQEDALAQGRRVYAAIRGWGISSDGSGGITRPEAEGQLEAFRRAYRRAGFGPDTVAYCEGHGTGTAVGDATELEVLSRARREANSCGVPPSSGLGGPAKPPEGGTQNTAVVGSIKANIGHCKAAAGLAGLIKAAMAVHSQVLPPITGCEQPHAHLTGPKPALRVLREPEVWPVDRPLRASVSAMGFGGINAHVVLEGIAGERRVRLSPRERTLGKSAQDAELFLLAAPTVADLLQRIEGLLPFAARISRSELTDLAAQLEKNLAPAGSPRHNPASAHAPLRAALIASQPAELAARLQTLQSWLQSGETAKLGLADGVFLGSGNRAPRIAFLFPGQGSPTHLDGGAWRRRFDSVRELYARAALPADGDTVSTRVVQPAVATASLAGLKVLGEFGVTADAAIGHSLGEITALHWAGAFDEAALLRIAQVRGAAMAALGSPAGAMLAVEAPWRKVQSLLNGSAVAVVGYNSPRQTVVAGEAAEVAALARRVEAAGLRVTRLPVSHAFHTPLVAAAVPVLSEELAAIAFHATTRRVVSTVTGGALGAGEDLRHLLGRQVTSPVRFGAALAELLDARAAGESPEQPLLAGAAAPDLLLEVGPGQVLTGLVHDAASVPVIALDAGGASLKGLLHALGAAYALGSPLKHGALFHDRFTRPFQLDWKPRFFISPCELAPISAAATDNALRVQVQAARDATLPAVPETVADSKLATPTPTTPAVPAAAVAGAELSPLELVRQLVAERAELPAGAVQDDSRMLSDLHLNSITVGQLVSEAAKRLGLPRVVGLTDFADASVAAVARALAEVKSTGNAAHTDDKRRQPPGVDLWIQSFALELVEARRARGVASAAGAFPGDWQCFAPAHHPFAAALRERLATEGGGGVLLCLPERTAEEHVSLLLASGRAALAAKAPTRFVLVQHGWGGAGFARTLHQELPGLTTSVINVPPAHPQTIEWVVAEVAAASGYLEAHYDAEGRRREPRLKLVSLDEVPAKGAEGMDWSRSPERRMQDWHCIPHQPGPLPRGKEDSDDSPPESQGRLPIGTGDVLLVTGGGKGIAAECALALGRDTGAKLALLGRSDPAADPELAGNLARIRAAGVSCSYVRADVTNAGAVGAAITDAAAKLGPITAILHGAGTNTPQLISTLDETAFRATLAPKLQGLRNVLAAVDVNRLRLLVTFGSIIARAGLRGEADYATANEWLTAFTEDFQVRHPRCRCLALEWSVWSGVGMGERLGRMETLIAQGITPIPPDEGVRMLRTALSRPHTPVALVVAGRFGEPPTIKFTEPELPLWRFLERKRAWYPDVELIVDAALSLDADPYLNDHVVQKEKLFPAVLGLEAMAQTAMALTGATVPPSFEQVELTRPIAVSARGQTTIRVAALRRAADLVEVCLRSEATDFHVDHFRALCRFGQPVGSGAPQLALSPVLPERLPLDPATELYGGVLFHAGRFSRVGGYRLLNARECVAELKPDPGAAWFGPYLPVEFVLGDPGARDAALHAIQACIPHLRILPTGIDRLVVRRLEQGACFVRAKERQRDGNEFIYDFEVTDTHGEVVERWEGLHLRAVGSIAMPEAWPEPLAGPYVERWLEELSPRSPLRVTLERGGRPMGSGEAIQRTLGEATPVWHRPDGKPVTLEMVEVSAAHAGAFTLAVAGSGRLGCDLEEVALRPEAIWRDLLGEAGFRLAQRIADESQESVEIAATRLWGARESLKKAGVPAEAPLVLDAVAGDGWVTLRSGALTIATCATALRGAEQPLVLSVAFERAAVGVQQSGRAVA